MANDLGAITIDVVINGQPAVKSLAVDLNNVAVAQSKVSNSAQAVISNFKQMRAAQQQVAQANTLAAASFSKLQLAAVARNLDTLTTSSLRYSLAAQESMQGANRFGMVAQQVGYQVGDFFVQVQSGTNALTAFGQQATQLAGLLPGVVGAIVGIGISLGTALGMAALRSRELTINFQQIGKDISAALQPIQGFINAIGTGLSYAGQAATAALGFLVDNLDRVVTYGLTAASLFAGKYVAGLVAAAAATASLSGALTFLRAALIRTGIGALVVGVGELVYQFTRLSEAAGGFGNAVGLLWNVVKEFGAKVVALFQSLGKVFEAAANKMASMFLMAINRVIGGFMEMSWKIAEGMNQLFQTDMFRGANLGEVTQEIGKMAVATDDAAIAAMAAADNLYAMATGPYESIVELQKVLGQTGESTVDFSNWLTKAEDQAKKSGKTVKELADAAKEYAETLDGYVVGAIEGVSNAWGEFVVRGFKDFKGFVQSVLDSFKNMLVQMIALAARNKILVGLGFATSGVGGLGATLNSGFGLNVAGGLGIGGGGLLSGIKGVFTGGGLGSSFANLGGLVSGSVGGLGAIGAALPAVGLIGAAVSFFRKKTTELDNGIRVVAKGFDVVGESFRTLQTSRFWGLSKKTSMSFAANEQVSGIFQNVLSQVKIFGERLGYNVDNLKDFSTELRISTKGLSEDQISEAYSNALQKFGDDAAKMLKEGLSFASLEAMFNAELLKPVMAARKQIPSFISDQTALQNIGAFGTTAELNNYILSQLSNLLKEGRVSGAEAEAVLADARNTLESFLNETTLIQETRREFYQGIVRSIDESGNVRYKVLPLVDKVKKRILEVVETVDAVFKTVFGTNFEGLSDKIALSANGVASAFGQLSNGYNVIKSAANKIQDFFKKSFGGLRTEFATTSVVQTSTGVDTLSSRITEIVDVPKSLVKTLEKSMSDLERQSRNLNKALTKVKTEYAKVRASGGEVSSEMESAFRGLARDAASARGARREAIRRVKEINLFITTIENATQGFKDSIERVITAPIEDALKVYLPTQLNNLSQSVKTQLKEIFGNMGEGTVNAFETGLVTLSDLLANNTLTVTEFNAAFKVLQDVFEGNISLTDEYTTKQQKVVDKLSKAYDVFTQSLEKSLSVVKDGIQALLGQIGQADLIVNRTGSLAYLQQIAQTGAFDPDRLQRAVGAVTDGSVQGFGTRQDFVRYLASTTRLLQSVEGALGKQLDTLQMQQVQAILNIEKTSESAATSLQTIGQILTEFFAVGGRIPQFANGGYHSGGLRIVGENGPELEATGPSRIFNAGQISVGGDPDLRSEIAQMRMELSTALVQIAKNTRKSAESLNKFDYQGLPESRGY